MAWYALIVLEHYADNVLGYIKSVTRFNKALFIGVRPNYPYINERHFYYQLATKLLTRSSFYICCLCAELRRWTEPIYLSDTFGLHNVTLELKEKIK